MKNLSSSADYGRVKEIIKVSEDTNKTIVDDRVVISILNNEAYFFLSSVGKPLVFSCIDVAEKYIKKNNIVDYEIDPFQDFDFTEIEIIEL